MSKATDLAKNTIVLAIGKLSSQAIGFILLPLYTYYMSPAEYGFVDLVVVYMNLLVPTLTLQMGMASFRYLVDARKNETERVRVVSNILHVTVPITVLWLSVFAIYGLAINLEYVWLILLTGLSLLVSSLAQQMTRGLGSNKQFTIASILIGLLTLLGALVFIVFMGLRVEGMLLSLILANVVASIYLVVAMRLYRYVKIGAIDRNLQKEMFGYSVPLIPNGIAWWAINASDRTIISLMISTAATGIYAVSTRYASMLGGLFGVFSMSWTEAASVHIDSPDRDKFFSQVANVAVRLFGALGLMLIATMPLLFPIMIGEGFDEAYMYIPLLVIGVFLNAIVGIYSAVYVAKKMTRQVMNTSLASAIVNIILTIGLIPLFGLYAAAGATALAFLLMAIYRHYDIKKYVNIVYDKGIFYVLTLLYVSVVTIYYIDTLWVSIIGLLVSVISGYLLIRGEIGKIRLMFTDRFKRKTT